MGQTDWTVFCLTGCSHLPFRPFHLLAAIVGPQVLIHHTAADIQLLLAIFKEGAGYIFM